MHGQNFSLKDNTLAEFSTLEVALQQLFFEMKLPILKLKTQP